jgi:hypothetical protein
MFDKTFLPSRGLRAVLAAALGIALAVVGARVFAAQDKYTLRVPDGLAFSDFRGYEDWQVVAVSQTQALLKVMVANPTMMDAYRAGVPGNGKPFPDGSRIAKIERKPKKSAEAPFSVRIPHTLQDVSSSRRTPGLTMIPGRTRSSPMRPASSLAALRAIREWRPGITFSGRTAGPERRERGLVPARVMRAPEPTTTLE